MYMQQVDQSSKYIKSEPNLVSDEEYEGEEIVDDSITLYGCGTVSKWRFPKGMERCPVSNCQELFDYRSEAIEHFKQKHAKRSILCYICGIPIYTYNSRDFESHFNRMHPDKEIPFQFNRKVKLEPKKV